MAVVGLSLPCLSLACLSLGRLRQTGRAEEGVLKEISVNGLVFVHLSQETQDQTMTLWAAEILLRFS